MKRIFSRGVLVAVTLLSISPLLLTVPGVAYSADAVRPEVGKPLQEAASLIKSQRYREALSKVSEADAASNKSAGEITLIERMRFSAAQGAGDTSAAASALDALTSGGHLSAGERLPMELAIAGDLYRAKDYARAQTWLDRYRKDGGTDPSARTLLVQTYYLNHDCASISREASGESGRTPSEEDLQLLANCYNQSGDKNGYANAMERLVTYYPKKDYWADLLARTSGRRGFADRLDLDLLRLRLMTGNLTQANDYMEMGQLSLESGYASEAKKVIAQGFSTNAFGTGPSTDRPKRLSDLIDKQLADEKATGAQHDAEALAAPEGDQMVNLGFGKVLAGNVDAGIAQMEKGIQKDNLKRPDDAKLHLGIAYIIANKKPKGRDILRTVKGADGTQDVARLWLIYSGASS